MSASPEHALLGLRHVALWIDGTKFDETVRFYREALGLRVDWHPDADNVYLTSGADNVALHRATSGREVVHATSSLDHVGFCLASAEAVEHWHRRLSTLAKRHDAEVGAIKRHRDGSTSFYLRDPAGNSVQMLHIPSLQH